MENNYLKLLKCLYVDDDSVIRLEAEDILGDSIELLVLAKDGDEGLQKYQNGVFDVVILDISMPGLNGVELSKKIKEFDPKQRIIITSSTEDAKSMIELVNIGVSRFFAKPLNFDALLEHLEHTAIFIYNEKRIQEYQGLLEYKNLELQNALTNLQLTQSQLVESEKMASLGGLVSGMAHELNTPVGICVTATTHMYDKLESAFKEFEAGALKRSSLETFFANAKDSYSLLTNNLEKISKMVHVFKRIATDRSYEDNKTKQNLKSIFEYVIIEQKREIERRNIKVEISCDESFELVCYKDALIDILKELITNSIIYAYDDKGGKIEIEAREQNSSITITIKDSGTGMDSVQAEKIFLPFYKSSGSRGIGLGLSIVYNLVTQKLNGKIECKSEPNMGTSMIVTIPITPEITP